MTASKMRTRPAAPTTIRRALGFGSRRPGLRGGRDAGRRPGMERALAGAAGGRDPVVHRRSRLLRRSVEVVEAALPAGEPRLVEQVVDVDEPDVRIAGDEVQHLEVPGRLVVLGRELADHAAGGVRAGLGADVAGLSGRVGLDADLVQAQRQTAAGLLADRRLRRAVEAVVERLVDPGEVRHARLGRDLVALGERLRLRDRVRVEVEPVHQRPGAAGRLRERLEPGAERRRGT